MNRRIFNQFDGRWDDETCAAATTNTQLELITKFGTKVKHACGAVAGHQREAVGTGAGPS